MNFVQVLIAAVSTICRLSGRCIAGLALTLALTGVVQPSTVIAGTSGVVLQYHRLTDSGPAITRTSVEDFAAHLALIDRLGFPVVPLDQLLAGLCDPSHENESAIAITFDDAHITVYEQAWPLLLERGWPFTVFVNTAAVDEHHASVMSWDQLRELTQAPTQSQSGTIIGNHGVDHRHMIRRPNTLNDEQWAAWRRDQIMQAQQRIDTEVGRQPQIFAYPYGEYDLATAGLLAELDYAAFGQQSGAFGCASNRQALPRFPVSGPYANPESVELKLAALPFPVVGELVEPVVSGDNRQPQLVLNLDPALIDGFDPATVSCFATGQGKIGSNWDAPHNQLTAQADQPLPVGRSRYNCTARNALQQRYHWFSQPWFIPDEQGRWSAE